MSRAGVFLVVFLALSMSFRLTRLVIAIRKAKSRGPGRTTAKPMFWIMTVSYLIFLILCAQESRHRLNSFSWSISLFGLVVYIAALGVREKAMRDLGRFFSPDIEIRRRHQVVRDGLYHYVRHPLLACMALEILGLGFVFNAYHALLFMGLGFYMPLILFRKSLEERALLASLGDAYRTYQQGVGAFWPRWHSIGAAKRGLTHV